MPGCADFNCFNYTGKQNEIPSGNRIIFYRVPGVRLKEGEEAKALSEERRRLWKAAINRKNITSEEAWNRTYICSRHFVDGKSAHLYQRNSPSWVPTLHLGYTNKTFVSHPEERYSLLKQQKEKKANIACHIPDSKISSFPLLTSDADSTVLTVDSKENQCSSLHGNISEEDSENSLCSDQHNQEDQLFVVSNEEDKSPRDQEHNVNELPQADSNRVRDASVQSDLNAGHIQQILEDNKARALESAVNRNSQSIFEFKYYEGDDDKVSFYTGLPTYGVLQLVYDFVKDSLSNLTQFITKEQGFFLCLIKLRLNYHFQDLAFQLGVSCSTVHKCFHTTLDTLYIRLSFLIRWPERENLKESMPVCFREHFGDKVAVIVDCFEIFSEKPSGVANQLLTYSNYKHHQTVKYCIGIVPQGVISFITEAWGGQMSDKCIIEESGMLNNLLPGDIIMADRGFGIEDKVTFYQAKLVIPNFTHSKKQLHPLEVESTKRIASVRVHVERVIGRICRVFTILQSPVPIEYMKLRKGESDPTIDKIVKVCCCMMNLHESVVPFE